MNKRFDVTKPSMPPIEEYIEELGTIWSSRWLTNMGEKYAVFSSRLKEYLNVNSIQLFCNGHNALELALISLDLPKGSEVITTPFTFVSTTFAIIRAGLRPVFCDINEDDFTIDTSKIESLISEKTRVILPVHVYGNVCDVEKIEEISNSNNLKVVYDAAHAFGEKYDEIGIGNFGDISMFSFHATKVFNTIEGGCLCYKDEDLQDKLRTLPNFGIKSEEEIELIGTNAKMNEFQAAMGICNLRHIDDAIEKRKNAYHEYVDRLADIDGIETGIPNDMVSSNYAYMPVCVNADIYGINRDDLYDKLKEYNIYARKYFYPLTNSLQFISNLADVGQTPVAESVASKILTLPIYEDISSTDIEYICECIKLQRK